MHEGMHQEPDAPDELIREDIDTELDIPELTQQDEAPHGGGCLRYGATVKKHFFRF
jgi:hypothetical protein